MHSFYGYSETFLQAAMKLHGLTFAQILDVWRRVGDIDHLKDPAVDPLPPPGHRKAVLAEGRV